MRVRAHDRRTHKPRFYTTAELETIFGDALDRDLLAFWRSKGWIKPVRGGQAPGRHRVLYDEKQVRIIGLLLQGYAEGLHPDAAHVRVADWETREGGMSLDAGSLNLLTALAEGDLKAALTGLASSTRQHLHSDNCAILLRKNMSDVFEIVAEADGRSITRVGVHLDANKADSPAWLRRAITGQTVNLFGTEVASDSLNLSWLSPDDTRRNLSILAVPIRDRKGVVVGVIKVTGKNMVVDSRAPRSRLPFCAYDREEEMLLLSVSTQAAMVVGTQQFHIALRELVQRLHKSSCFREFARVLLEYALPIFRADRGEVSRWDSLREQLVIEAVAGANTLNSGDAIPEPGITYSAFRAQSPRVATDVHDARDYHACNSSTRSEIAVPVSYRGNAIGVLNLESDLPGFQGGLDQIDSRVAQCLADWVAVAAQMVALRNVLEVDDHQWKGGRAMRNDMLASILDRILKQAHYFRHGIVYIADYRTGDLTTAEFAGCKRVARSIPFGKVYLATKVLNERRPYFSRFPSRDPEVSPVGLRLYDIGGSLAGVPLTFDTAIEPTIVGVLVLWCDEGVYPTEAEVHSDLKLAVQHARLAILSTPDASKALSWAAGIGR